jgi:nicotinate-nucleotide adenylyltransferase
MTEVKFSVVGIYGGTFDPIHYGHLRIAEELLDVVDFSQFYFVPSGEPRLRNIPCASKRHRKMMTHLAIQDNVKFSLDEREINRAGVTTTVASLREYRRAFGEDAVLCFIMGSDTFLKLHQWHCWQELFKLCHLVIVGRPGNQHVMNRDYLPQELKNECMSRWVTNANELRSRSCGLVFAAKTTLLEISATQIRSLIASGKSVRYLLPEVVYDYIKTNHLYAGEG